MEDYQHVLLFWLALSLCIGLGVGWWSYRPDGRQHWSLVQRWVLGSLRAVAIGTGLWLLLMPAINWSQWREEPPVFALLWDNSQSMKGAMPRTKAALKTENKEADSTLLSLKLNKWHSALTKWAERRGIHLAEHYLSPTPTSAGVPLWEAESSNLSALIRRAENSPQRQALGGALLISDGLYNQGLSPENNTFSRPLYVLGVGDTTTRQDIQLSHLLYNPRAYLGNRFYIEGLISQQGYDGRLVRAELIQVYNKVHGKKGKQIVVATQNLMLSPRGLNRVRFVQKAQRMGYVHYRLRIRPLDTEILRTNNAKDAHIEVLNEQIHVLILAPYPHPDVGMLAQVLKTQPRYKVDVVVLSAKQKVSKAQSYDLALFYDAYADKALLPLYTQLKQRGVACWWFITPQSKFRFMEEALSTWPVQVYPGNEGLRATAFVSGSLVRWQGQSTSLGQGFVHSPRSSSSLFVAGKPPRAYTLFV